MRFSLDDRSPLVEFEDLAHLTFEALAEVPDGKCMRGSRTRSGDRPDVVMAVEHSTGVVLDAGEAPAGGSEKMVARAMIRLSPNAPPSSTISR